MSSVLGKLSNLVCSYKVKDGSSTIQVQILPPPFISSVILCKLLNLQISGLRSPFYLKRSLYSSSYKRYCVDVMPMRWLRFLSAFGSHHTLVFGPLESWHFVYSLDLIEPLLPFPTLQLWKQVECV